MTLVLDRTLDGISLADVAAAARAAEHDDAGATWIGEIASDPFLAIALASGATEHIQLGTSVAIAFARSPMTLAMTAYDLQTLSQGRFILGIGSQVKGHITRRFSMPWTSPAARMKEYVGALRAIWTSWQTDTPLDFVGEFYAHTLMPPMFRPAPTVYESPKIMVAAVGERMVTVAGEVGDGLFVHPFTSPAYVASTILPAVKKGAARSGRDPADVSLACALLTATGETDEAVDRAMADARQQLAFYASTPAYQAVLAAHGWEEIQPVLAALVRSGQWGDLSSVLSDDMVTALALVGQPEEVAATLYHRWHTILDRVSLVAPHGVDVASWRRIRTAYDDIAQGSAV